MLIKIQRSIAFILFLTALEVFAVERSKAQDCDSYDSAEQEKAPVQKVGEFKDFSVLLDSMITTYTKRGEFEGLIHQKAKHEGLDLFNETKTSYKEINDWLSECDELLLFLGASNSKISRIKD